MSGFHRSLFVFVLALGLFSLGCNNRSRGGRFPDSGIRVDGSTDSGVTGDATPFDSGRDTSTMDSSVPFDSGRRDTSTPMDSGRVDSRVPDTGTPPSDTGFPTTDSGLPLGDAGICIIPSMPCPVGQMCCEILPGTGIGMCAASCP